MSDRSRNRSTATREHTELPDEVTLYPDPLYFVNDVPRDVMTVSRERAEELLAYGRRDTRTGKPAWDGDHVFAPAFHRTIQTAIREEQVGPDAPQWADPDEVDDESTEPKRTTSQAGPAVSGAARRSARRHRPSRSSRPPTATEQAPDESGRPDNPADQAADETTESPA